MLSLLRRTHTVQLITVIIVQMSHPTKAMPKRRQSRPRMRPLPRRQDLPRTQAFRAGKTFRAARTFRAKTPSLFRNPQMRPARLWHPPSTTPTGFPSYTRTSLRTSTQKGRVSPNERGVVTPLSDLPETSASPTQVSAAVTGMFHKRPNASLRPRRILPASLPVSTPLISVFTTSTTPHSDRISAPLLRTHGRYSFMIALYTTTHQS